MRFEPVQKGQMLGTNANGLAALDAEPKGLVLVCILGSNQALEEACRATLEDLCPTGYHLQQSETSDVPGGCDIYIWDVESASCPPPAMALAKDATKLVVVRKSSLSSVRRSYPDENFSYLQSPVTPLNLRVALEAAVARLQLRESERNRAADLNPDRSQILQKLLETNLKLQEYDQDRTNFLTRAIHDLRVPLMAVQGYCGLLAAGQLGLLNVEQTRILEKMQRSLTRLGRLAEAMLDLGTGAQPGTKLKLENASLESCIQQAVYEILPSLEKKQISLNLEVEPPGEGLLFDSGKIEQVLVNLLDNGCKFTPKGGSITIRGSSIPTAEVADVGLPHASGGYRIDVSDTGPGIAPAHLQNIFDEHTSYGDPASRAGFGLGLAICRVIIREHKGRIWASSDAQGATFSLVLPLAPSLNDSPVSGLVI